MVRLAQWSIRACAVQETLRAANKMKSGSMFGDCSVQYWVKLQANSHFVIVSNSIIGRMKYGRVKKEIKQSKNQSRRAA